MVQFYGIINCTIAQKVTVQSIEHLYNKIKNTRENSGTKNAINTSFTRKLFYKINIIQPNKNMLKRINADKHELIRIQANKRGYINNTAEEILLTNTLGYFIK